MKKKKIKGPKEEDKRNKTPDSSKINRHKQLSGIIKTNKRWNSIEKKETQKSNKKEESKININNNKNLYQDIENDLMINIHEVNMRRSMSQMETKQSQSSLYNDEINKDNKYKTQANRFVFINDKEKDKFKLFRIFF